MSLAWWLNEQKTLGPYVHPRFLSSTQTRETLRLEDPFTGKVLTSSVECATTEDVDAAVHAAEAALHATPEGAWQFPDARRQALIALADLIDKHRDAFIHIEGLTAGKPHWGAEYDVQTTIDVFRHFAGYADKIAGKVYQAHPGCFTSHTEKYPVGVVALIVSFNYPLMLTAWKLAPALAAGNAVLIKPSDSTPLSLLYLASLLQKEPSLFPPGVVSILPGDHVAGSHLASHPKIQKLSFTGSTPVGRKILSAAATSNLKRVTLELGGKSPIIVAGDWTDMDKLVNDIFSAAFCTLVSSFYILDAPLNEKMQSIRDRIAVAERDCTCTRGCTSHFWRNLPKSATMCNGKAHPGLLRWTPRPWTSLTCGVPYRIAPTLPASSRALKRQKRKEAKCCVAPSTVMRTRKAFSFDRPHFTM